MLGILLIDKPFGITSHDVVNDVRRRFSTKRVGHAGTLDPMATGLLVVAVGPATRFLQYLPLEPKEYEAEISFGHFTSTYDAEGEPSESKPVPEDLRAAIEEVLPKFRGLIQQLPPMYSAVKVNGKPLYQYARNGKEIERTPRTVHLTTFEVLEYKADWARVKVVCSGGTYVRSLANDLGAEIGCGAYLSKLVRHRVGRFTLSQALALDEALPEHLMPLEEAIPPMPLVPLTHAQTEAVREGRQIMIADPPSGTLVALLDPEGRIFSVARVQGNLFQPECVIPAEVDHGVA